MRGQKEKEDGLKQEEQRQEEESEAQGGAVRSGSSDVGAGAGHARNACPLAARCSDCRQYLGRVGPRFDASSRDHRASGEGRHDSEGA